MKNKSNFIMFSFLFFMFVLVIIGCSAQQNNSSDDGSSPPADNNRTLNLTVNYTGTGTVDTDHKIYAGVYDHANVTGASVPTHILVYSTNNISKGLTNITYSPFYIAVLYDFDSSDSGTATTNDRTEGYNNKGASPLDPVNVDAGNSVNITIEFDDTYQIP